LFGFEVASKVSTTLHTPLMSGANAIHGVILVGAIVVVTDHFFKTKHQSFSLATAAIVFSGLYKYGC
jgi:NAD(P) transhydrogenase subunit alpha